MARLSFVSLLAPHSGEPAAWGIPLLAFVAALLVALGATAQFARLLEALGDRWEFSPGLLGFVGAVGANLPNYAAALTASGARQPLAGQEIIIGSNVYNLAIIVGIAAFAAPAGGGIVLDLAEERDVLTVSRLALAMAITTLLTFALLGLWRSPLPAVVPAVAMLLTLGLFLLLAIHAFQRAPTVHDHPRPSRLPRVGSVAWAIGRALLALAMALGAVVIMVQAGQRFGATVHLPPALLSLVVLAVATSLPNTVVGYQLARTARVTTSVEEILSSNSVNLALGSALPLLIWPAIVHDPWLLAVDAPLMVLLTMALLVAVRHGRISRFMGGGLMLLYMLWVGLHMLM
jgi:cation:H+ antiporter